MIKLIKRFFEIIFRKNNPFYDEYASKYGLERLPNETDMQLLDRVEKEVTLILADLGIPRSFTFTIPPSSPYNESSDPDAT